MTPAGRVSLFIDGILVSTSPLDLTGTATFTVGVVGGTHTIVAEYEGDPTSVFAASASAPAYVAGR